MHVDLGGYHVRDIHFTAAFDIDARKVGKDLSEAIFAEPNNTIKLADVPHLGVPVHRGMTHDGLGKYLSEVITKADGPTADIAGILRDTNTHVVVSYLPVGSEDAPSGTSSRSSRRVRVRELRARSSSAASPTGRSASRSAACRSSATTSRARSARPSCTASSPA